MIATGRCTDNDQPISPGAANYIGMDRSSRVRCDATPLVKRLMEILQLPAELRDLLYEAVKRPINEDIWLVLSDALKDRAQTAAANSIDQENSAARIIARRVEGSIEVYREASGNVVISKTHSPDETIVIERADVLDLYNGLEKVLRITEPFENQNV